MPLGGECLPRGIFLPQEKTVNVLRGCCFIADLWYNREWIFVPSAQVSTGPGGPQAGRPWGAATPRPRRGCGDPPPEAAGACGPMPGF